MDNMQLIHELQQISKKTSVSHYKRAVCAVAATTLSTLQAESEKLRAELEQVKAERDALIGDFVDYVTDGAQNPAIFCKNRCDKCTDMRGWCTGKNCSGFYPSGAGGPKEGARMIKMEVSLEDAGGRSQAHIQVSGDLTEQLLCLACLMESVRERYGFSSQDFFQLLERVHGDVAGGIAETQTVETGMIRDAVERREEGR